MHASCPDVGGIGQKVSAELLLDRQAPVLRVRGHQIGRRKDEGRASRASRIRGEACAQPADQISRIAESLLRVDAG